LKLIKPILLVLLLFISYSNAQTQDRKRIQIEYSGFLDKDKDNYPGATILTRDDSQQVHIVHEGVNMWCDKAIHFGEEDFIEAYGNVKLIQGDSINMSSKYAEYSGKSKLAFASGDVILKEPSSTLTTDTLYFDRVKQQAYYRSKGKVVRDTSGTITSQIGRYYMDTKKYQFVKDVVLVNPDYTINTNRLDFYTESGHAFLYGPTTIDSKESKIYCEKGFYNTKNDTGYFVKRSRIDYDNRIFEGDSMYFDRNRSFASASNNIKVTDTVNNSIIKGHYAEVFREKDSVFITKRALAISVQDKDSLYIHGDTLMVTGKPEKRITRAFKNVKMYKSDMSGKADSIHIDHESGLTKLINISQLTDAFAKKKRPILWNFSNQMTGDTIHIKSNTVTEKLDSLIVFNNAFLVSRDTLEAGYNQISGQRLIGLFNEENKLYNVEIIKNSEVIYFARNSENELIGINKSKSSDINIKITGNTIDEIRLLKQIDGDLYPESKFPENARLLRGFNWREDERPKNVEDLFKDDPTLVLPVIKGIEDPLEEVDFFDNKMIDRIENSQKEENKNEGKENKAARQLPPDVQERIRINDSINKNSLLKKPFRNPK
jgi:lipopolysaccharide export system protein LptA